ncbi:MAG: hypothetical protein SVJ22_10000 [Halobacteriota archaeon]|nr:hypothetical protein [Halobacteriota archaeon]
MTQKKTQFENETCGNCNGEGCIRCGSLGYVLVAQPSKKCDNCGGEGCHRCAYTGWSRAMKAK